MTVFVSETEMKYILEHDSLVIVADRSYHPDFQIGTAGVVIESKSGYSIAKGFCRTHGHTSDQSAYRSELMGILLGLTWCKEFFSILSDTTIDIKFACDNITAVNKCFHTEDYVEIKHSNADLIWAIQYLIWNTKMNRIGEHVRGDQTEQAIRTNQLARTNDISHHLAADFLRFCIIYGEPAISKIPFRLWSVKLNSRTIVSNVDKMIQQHIYSNGMKEYRKKK